MLETPTWREALVAAVARLRPKCGDEAQGDARRLLTHVLGIDTLALLNTPEQQLSSDQLHQFDAAIARRLAHEPVARILGVRGFYGRDFVVTPATLDPRPDTETLIDVALDKVKARWGAGGGLDILDIGTGSGCLLLTLLAEFPQARGVGVDPSAMALKTAQDNARRLGIAGRAEWAQGRFEDVADTLGRRFSLIVSNPPYIPSAAIAALDPDVRNFDPHLALDGGADGLDVYRTIAQHLAKVAAPGWVLFETGHDQTDYVSDIYRQKFEACGIGPIEMVKDMADKPRCVVFEVRHSL